MTASQFFRRSLVVVLVYVFVLPFAACAQIDELLPLDLPFSSSLEEQLVYIPTPEIPLAAYSFDNEDEANLMHRVLIPELSEHNLARGHVTVNIGNVSRGYFKIKHQTDTYALVQVISSGGDISDFFNIGGNNDWEVFPLTRGDGVYTIQVLEHYEGRDFKVVFSYYVNVILENQNYPFLYPNRYVNFDENSAAVALAGRLAARATSDLEFVWLVYDYITTNVSFDLDFARAVYAGLVLDHVPDIDATLARGMGICFDFAILAASMMRSQNIPTKVEIGYVLEIFHAWVAVYVPSADWGNAAHPTLAGWGLLDPTTTSANNAEGFLNPVVNVNEYSMLFLR